MPMSLLVSAARAVLLLVLFAFLPLVSSASVVLDSGIISGTSANTGNFIVASSQFSLTAADIPNVELLANFDIIDDGVEIRVNGQSLFLAQELSQFGPQDFQVTAVQPNDIENPWSANMNGLPRLTTISNLGGTTMNGSVTTGASQVVEYLPNFPVLDFTTLLEEGDNTIEFVSHNGAGGASLQGDFTVTLNAVPEPSTALAGFAFLTAIMGRRRRSR